MNKQIITLLSSLLIAGSTTTNAQNGPRGPGGDRERPDFFALADKDESGTVSLDELVNSRIEMMNRRGGQGQGQQQQRDPEEMAARIKEQMSAAFKKADADENGELTKEEFATMPQGRGPRGGGQGGGGPRGPRGDDA